MNTPEERQTGLSETLRMNRDQGMLFDLGTLTPFYLTTSKMHFPLDLVFISQDLMVLDIWSNVRPGKDKLFAPECRYFLELNAGEASNIIPGEQIKMEQFNEEDIW